MPTPSNKADVLNREFLEVRAKILELAAALDRLDRAAGSLTGDDRVAKIDRGIAELASRTAGRAERVQQLFSRPYDPQWRAALEVDAGRK